jgi:tryptophan synthase alpha chain
VSRIKETFDNLGKRGESALVGFATAGDPDLERSLGVLRAMCESGVDVLELGVPFSDPTADGPVIQRASQRALARGMRLSRAIGMVRELRSSVSAPIVLFSYYNPVLAYGLSRFYKDALAAGADGVLVVDLPPEESGEMLAEWEGRELDLIRLVAPTTPTERMRTIADQASGFLYLVSMTGVTGSAGLDLAEVAAETARLKSVTELPVCVGFGISTPEEARAVARVAEGVVVGSAFERLIEAHGGERDLEERIREYTRSLKEAVQGAGR